MASATAVEVLLDHELAGISAAVSQSVARVGFRYHQSKSKGWQMVAAVYDREMVKRLPALIDTLTVTAYNRAKIEGYRTMGHTHVGVMPEYKPRMVSRDVDIEFIPAPWTEKLQGVQTAEDDMVCEECLDIADGAPYTLEQALDLLPAHIGCRCALVEWEGDEEQDALPEFLVLPVQEDK
jgi:hypothetical protein